MTPPIHRCRGNVFTEPLPINDKGRPTGSPLIRHGPYKKTKPPTILLLLRVFVATGACLPSHCLATMREDTHIDTQTDERDL
jgi:hypothetical protein